MSGMQPQFSNDELRGENCVVDIYNITLGWFIVKKIKMLILICFSFFVLMFTLLAPHSFSFSFTRAHKN